MTRPRTGGRPRALTALKRQTAPAPTVSDWRNRAVCRDVDPELFFPVGETGPSAVQIKAAQKVCQSCPVRTQCLNFALDSPEKDGVWGGISAEERRRMRRRRSRPAATDAPAA